MKLRRARSRSAPRPRLLAKGLAVVLLGAAAAAGFPTAAQASHSPGDWTLDAAERISKEKEEQAKAHAETCEQLEKGVFSGNPDIFWGSLAAENIGRCPHGFAGPKPPRESLSQVVPESPEARQHREGIRNYRECEDSVLQRLRDEEVRGDGSHPASYNQRIQLAQDECTRG